MARKNNNMFKKREETKGFDILNAGKQVEVNTTDTAVSKEKVEDEKVVNVSAVDVKPMDESVKGDELKNEEVSKETEVKADEKVTNDIEIKDDKKEERLPTSTKSEVNKSTDVENKDRNTGNNYFVIEKETSVEMRKISAYVKSDIWDNIGMLSQKTGISKTQILNKALEFALDNLMVEE